MNWGEEGGEWRIQLLILRVTVIRMILAAGWQKQMPGDRTRGENLSKITRNDELMGAEG